MGKSKKRKKPSGNPAKSAPHKHGDDEAVWIRTEPTPDQSGFMVVMEVDADRSIRLDHADAMQAAATVLSVVAYAEYDAAVLNQLTQRVSREAAMQVVIDLRSDRPEPNFSLLAPLSLTPGVNQKGEAFITVLIDEKPVGQWDIPDARLHAIALLEALTVADLDAAYLRCLKGVIGLEDPIARTVVSDLQDFRP